MLRYDRQTNHDLVTLYDIRPGNGAGPFLQPRSPHGAQIIVKNQKQTAIFAFCLTGLFFRRSLQVGLFPFSALTLSFG